jgi:tRNA modification GTPase
MQGDAIFAPITQINGSSVCVVRISGKNIQKALDAFKITHKPPHAYQILSKLYTDGVFLDEVLLSYFYAPKSFTGEDVIEISCHASPYILDKVLTSLNNFEGFRMAKPGEFSYRAFLNGKMDLTRAEGVLSLISAKTEAQHRLATQEFNGEISARFQAFFSLITEILALGECLVDFAEGEDLDYDFLGKIHTKIRNLIGEFEAYLDGSRLGQKVKNGIEIALFGEPNVGKSSIINRLAKAEIAIVSPIAGTTRDIIQTQLNIGGFACTIYDTAGLKEATDDEIEAEGIRRTQKKLNEADIKILVLDASKPAKILPNDLIVVNKTDLAETKNTPEAIYISAKQNTGFDSLVDSLNTLIKRDFEGKFNKITATNERHVNLLNKSKKHLTNALIATEIEILSEELRLAGRFIEEILGKKIETEDVLGLIFGQFCIGK